MENEELPRIVTPIPGPQSRALARRLREVECRGITALGEEWPIFWARARGALVTCVDGNRFLDLTGAFGVAAVGHGRQEVVDAVARQANQLFHGMGDVHPPQAKVLLLEMLGERLPPTLNQAILSSTGSEAVESALKTARLATGRAGVLAFEGGYHGLTYGALAVVGQEQFRRPFADQVAGHGELLPFPGSPAEGQAVLERLTDALASERFGALITEPIQGRGGIREFPEGFLQEAAERVRAADGLVIFDEVYTGFGRTGSWFAFEEVGVRPDILCLGKAMGGGFPISACFASREIMNAFEPPVGAAIHTSTFLGHPTGCAAAMAAVEILAREDLPARARKLGRSGRRNLEALIGHLPFVREIRGRGLMLGILLDDGERAFRVAVRALQDGLLLLPAGTEGKVISLTPPLTISDRQWRHGLEILVRILKEEGETDDAS